MLAKECTNQYGSVFTRLVIHQVIHEQQWKKKKHTTNSDSCKHTSTRIHTYLYRNKYWGVYTMNQPTNQPTNQSLREHSSWMEYKNRYYARKVGQGLGHIIYSCTMFVHVVSVYVNKHLVYIVWLPKTSFNAKEKPKHIQPFCWQ